MKRVFSTMLVLALLGCIYSTVFAAELLDVKPIVTGTAVAIEISADRAMTYTYYKIPGQARAVVDIADTDPEKVEPLIVVNKGVVSSISVDKAQISGIVISRIIFNLVSESDLSVSASADRKLLTVTFSGSAATAAKEEPKAELMPEPPAPAMKVAPPAVAAAAPVIGAGLEEDPLGLDEPAAKSTEPLTKPAAVPNEAPLETAPMVVRVPKLEPVVPVAVATPPPAPLTILGIATGTSYIEIRANQPITAYKTMRLTKSERLVIDISGAQIQQKPKTVTINKFGITTTRIGVSPHNIRVVIDSSNAAFPAYTFANTENGLRINFK